jgi:hypothetical protein
LAVGAPAGDAAKPDTAAVAETQATANLIALCEHAFGIIIALLIGRLRRQIKNIILHLEEYTLCGPDN